MKKILYQAVMLFTLLLLFLPTHGLAQNPTEAQIKSEYQQVADRVANKLMNCCSSFGGRNVQANVDFEDVKSSQILGETTIPMLVSWSGSWSGARYWIRGKLIIRHGGGMEWNKQNDSGGFSPGCSSGCIR
jgi:hypothetical protein